ncbi:type II secretion system protein [Thiomicrorhabdus sp.]|uniref:type II secretion system protein n=1 Tax=Thiomicrorhabdus sp. TaxID=2039724 RepID=UPI002AA7FC6B|nr:type II secretion system protein [Thiomicrorhabdus sp.]
MNMPYVTKRLSGFSLIELSIVLAILGVMFLAIPAVIPTIQQIFVAENDEQTLDRAESSIKGFLKAQSRFPCPDSNADGIEDCGAGVDAGLLPYKTLKLSSPVKNGFGQPIAYSVYRKSNASANLDADLASLKNRFSPILPNAESSTNSNGLDFCWALKNAIAAPNSNQFSYVGSSSSPYNQAFVLASPGASNANNAGTFFDGINQIDSKGFELPNKVIDSTYDDTVKSVGFAELAGELQCSSLLGRVNGAARTSYAMYDLQRLMDYTVGFRALALNVHEGNVDQAEFVEALAIADAAIYAAQTVIAIAAGAESFGVAVAAIAIPAVAAGALTVKGLIDAANGLSDAKKARDVASAQKTEADAQKVDIDTLYAQKLAKTKALDSKGWF